MELSSTFEMININEHEEPAESEPVPIREETNEEPDPMNDITHVENTLVMDAFDEKKSVEVHEQIEPDNDPSSLTLAKMDDGHATPEPIMVSPEVMEKSVPLHMMLLNRRIVRPPSVIMKKKKKDAAFF